MKKLLLILLLIPFVSSGQEKKSPYLTSTSPITLFSTQDGETEGIWSFSVVNPYDFKLRAEDSFTVVHLGPDHPPIVKTVYGTIATSIIGTPSMAVSSDGHYGLVTNHNWRGFDFFDKLVYPLNENISLEEKKQNNTTIYQLSNMIFVVDLKNPSHPVTHKIYIDDVPVHILAHPDGKRYFVLGHNHFFTYKLNDGKLVELAKSKIPYGQGCFWIHPNGKNILTSRSKDWNTEVTKPEWFDIVGNKVIYKHKLEIDSSVNSSYQIMGGILRISPDGKKALISQRTYDNGIDFADILIADLTLKKPKITGVIKQVGDGIESFAFHPNGKMAVATCLEKRKNSLAVLDVSSENPKVLYYLDAAGGSQGIEFSPEGDKLFLGSPAHGRIEVYDVINDFELIKNQKFIKIGYGHNSLSMGPRYN
jgi:WD40 repeat protein